FRSCRTMLASISPIGVIAVMLIVKMARLRRLGRCPSQIALAIAEVAIASSRGVIRAGLLAGGAVELLFAAALPTETVEVRGEGVDGMWDARWPAAESQILLVVGMDHIDPPVRTNHSEFEIEIAYGFSSRW